MKPQRPSSEDDLIDDDTPAKPRRSSVESKMTEDVPTKASADRRKNGKKTEKRGKRSDDQNTDSFVDEG